MTAMIDLAPFHAFDRDYARALRSCGKGTIIALNGAGAAGTRLLQEIGHVLQTGRGPRWTTESGDCYFASTDIMLGLLQMETALPFRLVTGRFDHADMPHPVFHAWLDAKLPDGAWVAINVSNLGARPLYAVPRADYLCRNACRGEFQVLPMGEFGRRTMTALRRQGLPRGHRRLDRLGVREFTMVLLRRTLAEARCHGNLS
ncbi:hypothetical protein OCH239_09760 [Roseivivax halodurans JCM 10272]|uniref:Uncharacterized protein n=1 Tax=Roseivivax halodurans JCM 10272 TaxID=1449350 RepID=X7ECG0_9RHOB|nr:hypothetical protein [Roseivivax halodurans]ETX13555.1 hypothetical protein OCH239_09760 [Roseivivax halodurans JCM 10272]